MRSKVAARSDLDFLQDAFKNGSQILKHQCSIMQQCNAPKLSNSDRTVSARDLEQAAKSTQPFSPSIWRGLPWVKWSGGVEKRMRMRWLETAGIGGTYGYKMGISQRCQEAVKVVVGKQLQFPTIARYDLGHHSQPFSKGCLHMEQDAIIPNPESESLKHHAPNKLSIRHFGNNDIDFSLQLLARLHEAASTRTLQRWNFSSKNLRVGVSMTDARELPRKGKLWAADTKLARALFVGKLSLRWFGTDGEKRWAECKEWTEWLFNQTCGCFDGIFTMTVCGTDKRNSIEVRRHVDSGLYFTALRLVSLPVWTPSLLSAKCAGKK